jgi:hypothetical protein
MVRSNLLGAEMNANELADWLIYFTEDAADYKEENIKQASTMLRQQQTEIEYWKSAFERAMGIKE